MKKKFFLVAGIILIVLTIINVNMGRHSQSFLGSCLSSMEALADDSEGGGGRHHGCGRAVYSYTPGKQEDGDQKITRCLKDCPDVYVKSYLERDC